MGGGAVRRGDLSKSLPLLGLGLGLALACATSAAHATAPAAGGTVASGSSGGTAPRGTTTTADAIGAVRGPAGAAMPLAGPRLPPPGYLDYCLRFRGLDQGCAW